MQTDDDIAMHEECDERSNISAKKTKKLVLKDLPSEAHQEFLQLYFEHTRLGGHTVSGVEVDNELAIALVEFSTSEAVDDILRRVPITISGQQVRVKPYFEAEEVQELCTVKVEGLHGVDKETIEMYFESEKRSGGDDIETMKLDEDGTTAYITFKSEEVAKRVAARDNHVLNKKPLKVSIHKPNKPGKEEQQETSVVKVKGLTKIRSHDALRYYFENQRRSGGGDITDVTYHDEDADLVFLTFCDPQIAVNVASRNHEVEGQSLQVSLHIPPKPRPFYKDKILIKGLQSTTTRDCLFNFLEAKLKTVPVELQTGEEEGVVLVTFDDQPDVEKLSKICAKLPLEGAMLQVSRVQVSNCIIVFNIPDNASKDAIQFYFENTRKSDGGQVDKVVMNEEECYCLVYFVDYSVVDKVLHKRHVIGGNVLVVKLYFDCLGCSISDVIGAPVKLPSSFVIHDVEPSKLKFMRQSQTTCDAIIHQMSDVNADIKLPNQDSNTNDIWINCTLTCQMADVRKLVKSWQETVSQNFENFMRNIVVAKHDGIQELWNPIMEKMKFLQNMNSDAAILLADREEGIISVVGLKQVVEIISKIISNCIKEVEDETEMEKQKVKETLTSLKLIETKMLHAQNFFSEMEAKFPSLKININQNMNEISFEGPACNITAAKLEMFETKEKYEKASIDMKGCRSFFSLYETEQAKNYIIKRLKDNHMTDAWDIKDKTLTVCSTCEESANQSLELVKKCILENRINLSSENLAVLKTDKWQIMLDEQKQKYPGKVEFEAQQKVAYVCSTDDIADEVLGAVKGYLRKNTITEEEIDFGLTINRLIQIDHEDEIASIGRKYDCLKTQIDYKESHSGFILRGTKDGVDDLKKELHILKDRVKNTLPTIEKSGSYRDKTEPAKEENEIQEEEKKQQATSVIKVKGLTRIKSFDTMRYYFENARRAGGGHIVEITYHEDDDDIVFLKYSDPKIAENVASRNHKVEGQSLHVSLYIPPKPRPFYKDKVLIKGLRNTTTEVCLFNFLEAKSGSVPVELHTGEKEGVVVVTFDDPPDFEKLSKICAKLPLEGATLQVFQVQVSNCIIVLNIPENTSRDTIRFYFENTRRSNGGPVDKVVMKEEECYCLVYFVDYSVVEKVLVKEHVVGANLVRVKLYLECLGCSTSDVIQTPLKLPDPFVIYGVEPSKLKFMRQSRPNLDAIVRQMNGVNANITWPDKDSKAKDIIINCTLTAYTANVRKLAKSWKETAVKKFEDFMKNIVVAKLNVIHKFWHAVMEKIKSLQSTNPDAAALLADKEQGIISVVGLKQTVEIVSRDISDCIKQVEDETEKEKQKVKETLTSLKLIETKMFLAQKFPSKMEAKYPSLKLKINQNKNEISFDGPAVDIKAAKIEMFETKEKYAKASVDMSGCRSFFSLYETKQAKDYIVKKLKNYHVTAVWEVNDQTLTVCSTCEESARKSLGLIKNCVAENRISLTVENLALLKTENWHTMLDEQKQKYPGKVEFEAQEKVAYVCSTDDIVDEVVGTVKRCLRKNTIIEDEIDFGKNINSLIEKYHKDEIANISKKYASLNAQINFKRNNAGFTLRGTAEGLDEIKKELNITKGRVRNKQHTIERPGIASHMKSSKGKEHINTVEEKHHVVIDSPDSDEEEAFYQNASSASKTLSTIGPRIHAECIAYDVKKIYTAEGDMTELPVDVLVNTADSKLRLTGGLSRAISLKGGIEIRNACQRYIRDEGELGEGEAFLSPAGNLTAKYVVHIVGPTWKGGANNEEAVLDESVHKSMKKASDKNVKSVALPAISSGLYSFPVKRATRIIAQAVKNFFREVQDSTITDVYLCDVKSNTVESFTDALVEVFGDRNVTKLPHKQLSARPKVVPRKSMPQRQPSDESSGDDDEYETIDKYSNKSGSYDEIEEEDGDDNGTQDSGALNITVEKGDITKVKCDCIVNSSNDQLDLSKGAVSQALMKVGGAKLMNECKTKARGMKTDGMVMTSAPGLPFKHIIHVVAQDSTRAWRKMIDICFKMAENRQLSSIAFPALGTNIQANATDIAEAMVQSLRDFEAKPHRHLQKVHFVIYQPHMVEIFRKAVEKVKVPGKGLFSLLSSLTGASAKHSLKSSLKTKKKKSKSIKVDDRDRFVIRVYSLCMENIVAAIDSLEAIISNEIKKEEFDEPVLGNLQEQQRTQIQELSTKFNVEIRFPSKTKLEVIGMIQNVMDANNYIYNLLRELERNEHEKKEAMHLTQIVQWFFIDITDEKQELVKYDPSVNLLIENAFKCGKPKVEFSDSEGTKYIIDFNKMQEYVVDQPDDVVYVIRRDLMKD